MRLQMKSINEIAKELDIPETTARRYVATFKTFLNGVKYGNVTKYPDQALEILEIIYNSYQAGKSTEEIKSLLEARFTQVIEVNPLADHAAEQLQLKDNNPGNIVVVQEQLYKLILESNKTLIEAVTEALDRNTEVLKQVADQAKEIQELKQEIERLKTQKTSILSQILNFLKKK